MMQSDGMKGNRQNKGFVFRLSDAEAGRQNRQQRADGEGREKVKKRWGAKVKERQDG